jgi:hypothetical protein
MKMIHITGPAGYRPFTGWRTMTAAQRRNARSERIWEYYLAQQTAHDAAFRTSENDPRAAKGKGVAR